MPNRMLNAQVPSQLADRIDDLSARLERPRSVIVEEALTQWIEREDVQFRRTLEGIADVDSGKTLPHAEVRRRVLEMRTDIDGE